MNRINLRILLLPVLFICHASGMFTSSLDAQTGKGSDKRNSNAKTDQLLLSNGFKFTTDVIGMIHQEPWVFDIELDKEQAERIEKAFQNFKSERAKIYRIPFNVKGAAQRTESKTDSNSKKNHRGDGSKYPEFFRDANEAKQALAKLEFQHFQNVRKVLLRHQQVRLAQVMAWFAVSSGDQTLKCLSNARIHELLELNDLEQAQFERAVDEQVQLLDEKYSNELNNQLRQFQSKLSKSQIEVLAKLVDQVAQETVDSRRIEMDFALDVNIVRLAKKISLQPEKLRKAGKLQLEFSRDLGRKLFEHKGIANKSIRDQWEIRDRYAKRLMDEEYAVKMRTILSEKQLAIYERLHFEHRLIQMGPFRMWIYPPLVRRAGLNEKQVNHLAGEIRLHEANLYKFSIQSTGVGFAKIVQSLPAAKRQRLVEIFGDPPPVFAVKDFQKYREFRQSQKKAH